MRRFEVKGKAAKKLAGLVLTAALALSAAFSSMAAESAMDVICAPAGVVQTPTGELLVTDTYNKVVWKVVGRTSAIYAGTKGVTDLYGEPVGGYNDAQLAESLFKEPWGISPFLDGYAVSDPDNNVVRFIKDDGTQTATVGQVTTYAENLLEPTGLCYKNGFLYVEESGRNRIVQLQNGTPVAAYGTGIEGNADGPVSAAQFSCPQGVAVSDDGIIYVSDTGNNAVKKIQGGNVMTLLACDQASLEQFPVAPMGLMVYGSHLYICDNFSRKLLVIPR
ncbi:MAG: NHL repeat-containing protein [Clostridium sp.]|nr:NHL repeat-containing protein [Clostridium sp.]